MTKNILKNIIFILKPEFSFYVTALLYSIGVSLLSLAIPISVQALVNSVTFGVLIQPLVVLSLLILGFLMFSGTLNALQAYIVELFQRYFYARTSAEITLKLLGSTQADLEVKNGSKFVNKYFDIMTVQKSVSHLMSGGVSIVLQMLVGLILLAFYHPYFLIFDIILLFLLWLSWVGFWKSAIVTAVNESKAKYAVASWLEEIARLNLFFKSNTRKEFALNKADDFIKMYLSSRKEHFRHTFSQNLILLAIYSLMSASVLGLGGYLVIKGELTLGQLVAAELVVTVILSNLAKSSKYLISFYDLYAAIDKLTQFYDLPTEKVDHHKHLDLKNENLQSLSFNNVEAVEHNYSFKFSYSFQKGKSYYIYSRYDSSLNVLVQLLQKVKEPKKGAISIGEYNFRDIASLHLRDIVYVIDRVSIMEGSLRDNLVLGNKDTSLSKINDALDAVKLTDFFDNLPEGLETQINSSGYPLWSSQLIRLEIARAILAKPKVIVFTSSFEQIEKRRRKEIICYLRNEGVITLFLTQSFSEGLDSDYYIHMHSDKLTEFNLEKEILESIRVEDEQNS